MRYRVNPETVVFDYLTTDKLAVFLCYKHTYMTFVHSLQEEEPNDRKIGKLCEYAAKNPFRIPKVYSFAVFMKIMSPLKQSMRNFLKVCKILFCFLICRITLFNSAVSLSVNEIHILVNWKNLGNHLIHSSLFRRNLLFCFMLKVSIFYYILSLTFLGPAEQITKSLEERCYKELRNENFRSAKVVMCIYKKLVVSCKEHM